MFNIIYTIIMLNHLETSNYNILLNELDVNNIIPAKIPASEANMYINDV